MKIGLFSVCMFPVFLLACHCSSTGHTSEEKASSDVGTGQSKAVSGVTNESPMSSPTGTEGRNKALGKKALCATQSDMCPMIYKPSTCTLNRVSQSKIVKVVSQVKGSNSCTARNQLLSSWCGLGEMAQKQPQSLSESQGVVGSFFVTCQDRQTQ